MITTIARNATSKQLVKAVDWVSDQLHVPWPDIGPVVAVAYVVKHFRQGDYEGWDGFIEMISVDEESIAKAKEN